MRPELDPPFRMISQPHGDATLIRISGALDLAAVDRVETAVDEALAPPPSDIVFDLTSVTFLDMAGVAALLRANQRARDFAAGVQIVPPTGLARRIFTLTGVRSRLTLTEELPEP